MEIKDRLARLGVRGNHYKVYCAVLEQKEASISSLAARAGLPRGTTYDAVTRLEELGLVKCGGDGSRRTVRAVNPGVLLEQIAAKRQMITELLPELQSLYNRTIGKPKIRFYEGREGIKTVLWETLGCSSGVLHATFSMSELQDTPGIEEINRYAKERIARGIRMQVIRSSSRDVAEIWPDTETELREVRFTPDDVTISMTSLIYDNSVVFISSRQEDYGLIIESGEFAAFQRSLFTALWQISHPVDSSVML